MNDAPTPPAVLTRLATLAADAPPLADALQLVADDLARAHDARLGSDHRQEYLWEAVAKLVKVVAYLAERERWREAAVQVRWDGAGL